MPDPMTTTDPKLIERIARVLCELHIRTVRRHDTPPDELEEMLPAAIKHAWREYEDQARAIFPILAAAINEAVQNERAGIVAWLRSEWGKGSEEAAELAAEFADAIERGEHLPSPPAIEAHKESGHGDA